MTYRIQLRAAAYLLAAWAHLGSRAVRLAGGRVWPEPVMEPGWWAIDDERAAAVLVATVGAGERYPRWREAVRLAERDAR